MRILDWQNKLLPLVKRNVKMQMPSSAIFCLVFVLQQSSGKQVIFNQVFSFSDSLREGKRIHFSHKKSRKTKRKTWSNVQGFKDIQENIIRILALSHSLFNTLVDCWMSMTARSHHSRKQSRVVLNYVCSHVSNTSKHSEWDISD